MRHQLRNSFILNTFLTRAQQHTSTKQSLKSWNSLSSLWLPQNNKCMYATREQQQTSEWTDKKAQYHGYRRTVDRTAFSHGINGVCTWRTELARVSARDQRHAWACFQQAHHAGVRGILLRRWHGWFLCVVNMVVVVAIRLYQLQRISVRVIALFTGTAFARCIRAVIFCNTSHVVVSRSFAALFYEDTNTRLKVKWLYCKCSADRPIMSLTYSQQVSYISLPTVTIGHLDNTVMKYVGLPKTIMLLFKRFENLFSPIMVDNSVNYIQ